MYSGLLKSFGVWCSFKNLKHGNEDENSHYCHSAIEPGTEPPASPLRCDSVCLYESAADCLSVPSSAQTNRSFARISVCHRSVLEKLFLFVRNPTRRRSSRPVCCCSSEVCVWEQWIFSSLFLENKKRGNAPNIRQGRSQTSLEHDSFVTATMWQLWIQRVAFRGFVLTEVQDVCVWGR